MTDPREVVAGIIKGDVQQHRDPALWFVTAHGADEIPRIWAKGKTENEARANAREAVRQYVGTREGEPGTEIQSWHFVPMAPEA